MNLIVTMFSVVCLTAMGLAAYGSSKHKYNEDWEEKEGL